jgi:hypothetical protein
MQRYKVTYMLDGEPDTIYVDADSYDKAELLAYAEIPTWSIVESIRVHTEWIRN